MSNYGQKVSTPIIIDRAKKGGFYLKKSKRKSHDREVLTKYVGEFIGHYSSHHKCNPYADKKWYLITSIDNCSRYLLYYKLIERETSWTHIEALEKVALKYGSCLFILCRLLLTHYLQKPIAAWTNILIKSKILSTSTYSSIP